MQIQIQLHRQKRLMIISTMLPIILNTSHTHVHSLHNQIILTCVQWHSVCKAQCVYFFSFQCAECSTLQWGGAGGPSPPLFATLSWHPGVQVTLSSTSHTLPPVQAHCTRCALCTLCSVHTSQTWHCTSSWQPSTHTSHITLPPMPLVTANQPYQLTLIHPASKAGPHHRTG